MPDPSLSLSSFPNAVVHMDCDAFFTSVEQALKPELRGLPVVTGKERGIVACASYEAKALGVKRPMKLYEAKRMCPSLVCLPSDYETYSLYSKRLFEILRRFTPAVEEYSIDEAFAELGGLRRVHHTGYPEIAARMKAAVQEELGLTVSVGLSATKSLAKLASKEKKPDGFTVVRANELEAYLPTVALERVCGFGPNTVALLTKLGLRTVWDYVSRPEAWAKATLGKIGVELWHELRGERAYPVNPAPKEDYASVSKCKTFTPPSADREFVRAQLMRNLESAFIKLRRYRLRARAAAVYLRDHAFGTTGMEAEFERATSSTIEAARLVSPLFDRLFDPRVRYRLTGIVLFKLERERAENVQYTFFDDVPKIRAFERIDRVIDGVNELFGKHALHLGSSHEVRRQRHHENDRGDVPERKKDLLPGETARQRLGLPLWRVKV